MWVQSNPGREGNEGRTAIFHAYRAMHRFMWWEQTGMQKKFILRNSMPDIEFKGEFRPMLHKESWITQAKFISSTDTHRQLLCMESKCKGVTALYTKPLE